MDRNAIAQSLEIAEARMRAATTQDRVVYFMNKVARLRSQLRAA